MKSVVWSGRSNLECPFGTLGQVKGMVVRLLVQGSRLSLHTNVKLLASVLGLEELLHRRRLVKLLLLVLSLLLGSDEPDPMGGNLLIDIFQFHATSISLEDVILHLPHQVRLGARSRRRLRQPDSLHLKSLGCCIYRVSKVKASYDQAGADTPRLRRGLTA
jgi:hypothetical protein